MRLPFAMLSMICFCASAFAADDPVSSLNGTWTKSAGDGPDAFFILDAGKQEVQYCKGGSCAEGSYLPTVYVPDKVVGIAIKNFDVGLMIYLKSVDKIGVAEFGSATEVEFTRKN